MRARLREIVRRVRLAFEVLRLGSPRLRCVCEHTIGHRVIGVGTIEGACRHCPGAPSEEPKR